MRFLVVGGGFRNKGAEAMLRTVQAEFAKRLPDSEFILWGCSSGDVAYALSCGFLPVSDPTERSRLQLVFWLASRMLHNPSALRDVVRPKKLLAGQRVAGMLEMAGPVDAVLDVSGFAYGDQWRVLPLDARAVLDTGAFKRDSDGVHAAVLGRLREGGGARADP